MSAVKPIEKELEDLDFEVPCQSGDQQVWDLFGVTLYRSPVVRCTERATWQSTCKGCGMEAYVCARHRSVMSAEANRVFCVGCFRGGDADEVFAWRRLPGPR